MTRLATFALGPNNIGTKNLKMQNIVKKLATVSLILIALF